MSFNWQFYLNKYPDLRANGVHTKEQAINHWNKYGKKEGRTATHTLIYRGKKNILIYTHMEEFNINDGGTVVQYYLAKILEEKFGCNVRIYPSSGKKILIIHYLNFLAYNHKDLNLLY